MSPFVMVLYPEQFRETIFRRRWLCIRLWSQPVAHGKNQAFVRFLKRIMKRREKEVVWEG
jgi:hypothetical protein